MVLRVKLEIIPYGEEDKAREIGRLDIFNKGEIDLRHCEYGVIQLDNEHNTGGLFAKTVCHRRSRGAWALVGAALSELVNKEALP